MRTPLLDHDLTLRTRRRLAHRRAMLFGLTVPCLIFAGIGFGQAVAAAGALPVLGITLVATVDSATRPVL